MKPLIRWTIVCAVISVASLVALDSMSCASGLNCVTGMYTLGEAILPNR